MRLLTIWVLFILNPTFIQELNFHPSQIQKDQQEESEIVVFQNKTIPVEILDPVKEALGYFPDLEKANITFEYKERISGAVMQAQPKVFSLFVDGKENRKYRIKITRYLDFGHKIVPIEEIPHDALVGWIGHELGHIMDYIERSSTEMMRFGFKYLVSKRKVIEAEMAADSYAIECGMGHQILANKNYILNHEGFDDEYKDKIKTLYMSPEDIITLQEELKYGEESLD